MLKSALFIPDNIVFILLIFMFPLNWLIQFILPWPFSPRDSSVMFRFHRTKTVTIKQSQIPRGITVVRPPDPSTTRQSTHCCLLGVVCFVTSSPSDSLIDYVSWIIGNHSNFPDYIAPVPIHSSIATSSPSMFVCLQDSCILHWSNYLRCITTTSLKRTFVSLFYRPFSCIW